MADQKHALTPFRMTAAVAEQRIRKIATLTENIILGTHARERMHERGISASEVYRVLRMGYVDDQPCKTTHQEWKCKVTLKIKGDRTAGVVTVILHNGKLFVKTVEWENLS